MRGESARRAVTRGEDLLTGRDRVDGDRYQVDTVGGGGGFCGTWGAGRGLWSCRSLWRQLAAAGPSGGKFWPLQVSLAAIGCCRAVVRLLHSPLF